MSKAIVNQPIKDTTNNSENAREERGDNSSMIPEVKTTKEPVLVKTVVVQPKEPIKTSVQTKEVDPREAVMPADVARSKDSTNPKHKDSLHTTGPNLKVVKTKAKIRTYLKKPGTAYFWCPGCKEYHSIHLDHADSDGTRHVLSGTAEFPTVSSMISRQIESFNTSKYSANYEHRCNSFITDGRIRFLENCTHPLAGKIVDLPYVD